jgi:hypothetical protein
MTTACNTARDCAQRYPWSLAVVLIITLPSTCLLINRAAATGAVLHIGSTTSRPSRPSLPGLSSLSSDYDSRNFIELFAPLCKPGKLMNLQVRRSCPGSCRIPNSQVCEIRKLAANSMLRQDLRICLVPSPRIERSLTHLLTKV